MTYFQGFLLPVPKDKQQAYREMAESAAPIFADYGATRLVECWSDDVMIGKTTDMLKAVQATDDETVVFSWVDWPDKATCDAAHEKMMQDERMKPSEPMPFDGKRMIFAGFETVYDSGGGGRFGYVDGMVASVPEGGRDAFLTMAEQTAAQFLEQGALRTVDGWGVDVPDGKVTDFRRAVQAKAGETVVFGWVEWPDKPTRDAGMAALMKDERMSAVKPAWNGPLAIFGGFAPIVDAIEAN